MACSASGDSLPCATSRPRRILPALLLIVALTGCTRPDDMIVGSPDVPAEFGPVASGLWGCESIDGLYAWPPRQGEPDVGELKRHRGPRLPILMPTALPLYAEAQLWIQGDSSLVLRSRMVNRNPKVSIRALTTQWGYDEISGLKCRGGQWAWDAPPPDEAMRRATIEQDRLADTGAGAMSTGIRFTPMADGGIAIGQWTRLRFRADGRNGPPDAGESVLDPADKVIWSWSVLERLGDTGEGQPPEDAALKPSAARATQ